MWRAHGVRAWQVVGNRKLRLPSHHHSPPPSVTVDVLFLRFLFICLQFYFICGGSVSWRERCICLPWGQSQGARKGRGWQNY